MKSTIPFNSWYTFKRDANDILITGYDPNDVIGVGSECLLGVDFYEVLTIERRDHKGTFIDENNRVNSFYSARLVYKMDDSEREVRAKYGNTHTITKVPGSIPLETRTGDTRIRIEGFNSILFHWVLELKK